MDRQHESSAPACCDGDRIARHFDSNVGSLISRGEAEKLADTSTTLLRHLLAAAPSGKSVLELGSGRAGLLLHLAQARATRVTGVDLSRTSIDFARARFDRAGLADRAEFILGNGALQELATHDWVILDRAICCYPNLEELLANSIPAARELYAYTVPESRGARGLIARVGWALENRVIDRLRQNPCPGYVHDLDRIDAALQRAGFRETAHDHTALWHVAVFERDPAIFT
jgi:SAM-dependent methyltransferase